ncbi:hypothetical protein [uncultured Shewanella sp.]|uniref:hypothetical protein n=1 Tax=uncultured Shewanella sp. TaxID=173975 RepID=UPI002631CB21|nr:hypothetical protein [uncultured Shewanella sp.]
MRALYDVQHARLNPQEQQAMDDEMRLLNITPDIPAKHDPIAFWSEHETALIWWLQVQDLMRYSHNQITICEGLDVVAVQADVAMSGRQVDSTDYQKLRLIGHTVTGLINEKLMSS